MEQPFIVGFFGGFLFFVFVFVFVFCFVFFVLGGEGGGGLYIANFVETVYPSKEIILRDAKNIKINWPYSFEKIPIFNVQEKRNFRLGEKHSPPPPPLKVKWSVPH